MNQGLAAPVYFCSGPLLTGNRQLGTARRMLGRGLFQRVGAYAVLALGFWLLYQAFERSNILSGIIGGALIIVGMYFMTGVWRDTFDRFGGHPRVLKERRSSDITPEEQNGETGDTTDRDRVDGSDQGGQLPP